MRKIGADQVEAEETDAPEAHDPRESEEHADDRITPPTRVTEHLANRPQFLGCIGELGVRHRGFGRHGLPSLRFLQAAANQDAQKRGQRPNHEHHAPTAVQVACLDNEREDDSDERGDHIADCGEGLEEPERERPGTVGHHLGDERHSHGELTANAQAGQEPENREVPRIRREGQLRP